MTARGNRLFGHNTICIRHRRECETGSSQHKSPHKARAFRRGLNVVTSSVKAIRMSARTVFTNEIHGNFYIYTGIQLIESFFVSVVTCLNSVSPLGASEAWCNIVTRPYIKCSYLKVIYHPLYSMNNFVTNKSKLPQDGAQVFSYIR